jgi:hypothetical protein
MYYEDRTEFRGLTFGFWVLGSRVFWLSKMTDCDNIPSKNNIC